MAAITPYLTAGSNSVFRLHQGLVPLEPLKPRTLEMEAASG